MAREYDAEMGTLGSALARWRSYRQMHRVLIVVFVLFTILVLDRYRVALGGTFAVSDPSARTPAQIETVDDGSAEMDESMLAAGNSTLGFHKIFYINMRARHDREDAMALQSYISGVETTDFPAVEADLIDPVGMPPTHRPSILKVGEKGCWRAHANVRPSPPPLPPPRPANMSRSGPKWSAKSSPPSSSSSPTPPGTSTSAPSWRA